LNFHAFPGPEALAAALAEAVAGALRGRLARAPQASLAVSGGTTPVTFFDALSRETLDWARVAVTLVDERYVPESSPRSNARLVRAHLLQNQAAAAAFLPLAAADEAALAKLPAPFAAVVLGMGLDGHTASYFPGGDGLAAALSGPHLLQAITAPGAEEPRVTLTWPALATAEFLALHIQGTEKRAALDAALQPGDVVAMPVRVALRRQPPPEVYWCP